MVRSSQSLTYVAATAVGAWSSVAIASFCIKQLRRRKNEAREKKVLKDGGLLPQARNIVEALQYRATKDGFRDRLALEGADGTTFSWKEYHEQIRAFANALKERFPGIHSERRQ
jgi:acyl-coenzyme A synthetase/AMP-(fatty) acid ligase